MQIFKYLKLKSLIKHPKSKIATNSENGREVFYVYTNNNGIHLTRTESSSPKVVFDKEIAGLKLTASLKNKFNHKITWSKIYNETHFKTERSGFFGGTEKLFDTARKAYKTKLNENKTIIEKTPLVWVKQNLSGEIVTLKDGVYEIKNQRGRVTAWVNPGNIHHAEIYDFEANAGNELAYNKAKEIMAYLASEHILRQM